MMRKKAVVLAMLFLIASSGIAKDYSAQAEGDSIQSYQAMSKHKRVEICPEKLVQTEKPKNVIFMIGDGMGVSQIFAALTANSNQLNMEYLKHIGFQKTQSANKYVTDSAAAGTALATGHKTTNKMLGVTPDTNAVANLVELSEKKGMETGIVVTCTIVHATPASYYAHQNSRYNYYEIADDFTKSGIDVAIGGGYKYFEGDADHPDLLPGLKASGYTIVRDFEALDTVRDGQLLAPLWENDPPKAAIMPEYLEKGVASALNHLKDAEKGFFLMVEGSQIDWAGHGNDTAYMVEEVLAFDRAVGEALKFAEKEGNTLILCTADHETGGMMVLDGNMESGEVMASFATGSHTGTMVPVMAEGPGAQCFNGFYENTEIVKKICELMQF